MKKQAVEEVVAAIISFTSLLLTLLVLALYKGTPMHFLGTKKTLFSKGVQAIALRFVCLPI
jgi:hypothetical protein